MYELVRYVNSSEQGDALADARSGPDVAQNRVHDLGTARGQRSGRAHVALEDGGKRRPVGHIENAQGADRHVQVYRVNIASECALALTARQQIAQRAYRRRIEPLDCFRTGQVDAVEDVLVHYETNEFRVGI